MYRFDPKKCDFKSWITMKKKALTMYWEQKEREEEHSLSQISYVNSLAQKWKEDATISGTFYVAYMLYKPMLNSNIQSAGKKRITPFFSFMAL